MNTTRRPVLMCKVHLYTVPAILTCVYLYNFRLCRQSEHHTPSCPHVQSSPVYSTCHPHLCLPRYDFRLCGQGEVLQLWCRVVQFETGDTTLGTTRSPHAILSTCTKFTCMYLPNSPVNTCMTSGCADKVVLLLWLWSVEVKTRDTTLGTSHLPPATLVPMYKIHLYVPAK